ncbi:MAG: hypothetical protein GXP22_02545 [Gammaproteobacteria bacterium]|nr:hypothetical protein [Gammaproteobacteria bacterium]
MVEFILKYEASIRLSMFIGAAILLALWEWYRPRRKLTQNKSKRWLNNISLIISGTILVRFFIPVLAVGVAYLTEKNDWGFANHFEMSGWARFVVTFVLLDLIIYLQHLNFHEIPVLWRLHRVHHSDRDCDVSTGVRFHPIEILLSILIKMTAIIILGAPVIVVVVFELMLNVMSMFTHSNIALNERLERILRWVFVTPDMHRIHHSTRENEANSNFSFHISLWDRLFGTYIASPEGGHLKMKIGLDQFDEDQWQTFTGLLYTPFSSGNIGYSINRRDTRNADELHKLNEQLKIEINEKKEHEKELIIARDKAYEASRIKSEFLSNMSHELRTPMHAILSYSSLGMNKIDNAERDKLLGYYTRINMSGERLLVLINDLLDLSKLEAGKVDFLFKNICMQGIVESAIAELDMLAQDKGVDVRYIPAKFDTDSCVDADKIMQVMLNLLSNAIKFTPAGGMVNVQIKEQSLVIGRRNTDNSSMPALAVSVIDQGVGIPEDELEAVFDKFVQSSQTKTTAGGTGLGLSICKQIINCHRGTIAASNNSGKGAAFTFVVPRNLSGSRVF